jgi:flagellar L-ring protein precursor FlgH
MSKTFPSTAIRIVLAAAAAASLSGCNALTRMSEVGEPPKISKIQNPTQTASYHPVSMPMPAPVAPPASANSLWRPGARAFFKDQRAAEVGDILTVAINIDKEKADFKNKTTQTRNNSETTDPIVLGGLERQISKILPSGANPAAIASFGSDRATLGDGTIGREESLKVNLAAVITQILPNGNLVIAGKQEVRVNYELRELTVTGVIRPEDITSTNTIAYDKIAEARISYGGRGTLSDMQQPRYGQQIFDIIFPF